MKIVYTPRKFLMVQFRSQSHVSEKQALLAYELK